MKCQLWLPMPIDFHAVHHMDSWCADVKYKVFDLKTYTAEWHETRVFGNSVKQCAHKFEHVVAPELVKPGIVIKDWKVRSCYRMFVKNGGGNNGY